MEPRLTHPILERLTRGDPKVRRDACREAADDPSAVLLLDALGEALGDPEESVAAAAAESLSALAGRGGGVDRVLRRALRSDSPGARWRAALVLADLAPPDAGLLPVLVEALGGEERSRRWQAARLLVETGRSVGEVLPLLVGLARGGASPPLRGMAIHCLREMAPEDPQIAAVLREAARDPEPEVRRAAQIALAGTLVK